MFDPSTVALIITAILSVVLCWLLLFTEMSYLGNTGNKLLYNIFALIYENKWKRKNIYTNQHKNRTLFLEPLKEVMFNKEDAQFLDLACGTGRISMMVLSESWFRGKIKAIDFSEGMLNIFRNKLRTEFPERAADADLRCIDLQNWEPTETYDAVCLLEAGEFLPNFVELIGKIGLATKPNGVFILTKPPDWMSWAFPKRMQTERELRELLESSGFTVVRISDWHSRYEVILCNKVNYKY